jgi:hypothetical protein
VKEFNSFALQKDKGLIASVEFPIVLSTFGISGNVFCPQANEYKNVSIVNRAEYLKYIENILSCRVLSSNASIFIHSL